MDKEKEVHNQLLFQVNDLKQQRDTLRSQKLGLRQGLDTCKRINDELVATNQNLSIKLDKANSHLKLRTGILYFVTGLAIIETMIILVK